MKNDRSKKRNESIDSNGSDYKSGKSESTSSKFKNKRNSRSRGGNKSGRPDFRNSDSNNGSATKLGIANDESWYTQSPEQVTNAANVSFTTAVGKKLVSSTENRIGLNQSAVDLPGATGVMRVGYIPTFGNPQDPSDALNVGLQKTYADTRKANAGTRVYYYPDFAKYLMVMDCAYAFAGTLIRAVGYLNSFSSANKYLPKALFSAMGFSYDDLSSKQPEFRLLVNNFISKLNTMNVPDTLPVFKRHFWLGSNVYSDADNAWSQLYIHVPEVYAKYNYETADVDLIMLNTPLSPAHTLIPEELTLNDIRTICNDITSSILLSETFSVMSGDIFKAYGNALFKIEGVSEAFTLYPVFDAGVLNQIMNGTFAGAPYAEVIDGETTNWQLAKKGNTIFKLIEDVDGGYVRLGYNSTLPGSGNGKYPAFGILNNSMSDGTLHSFINNSEKLINITSMTPTPGMVLESTRTSAVVERKFAASDLPGLQLLKSCGADVYTTFRLYYYITKPNGTLDLRAIGDYSNHFELPESTNLTTRQIWANCFETLTKLSHFDWHPIVHVYYKLGTSAPITVASPFVDTYNTALVSRDTLTNMHEVANLSLFDVTLRNYIH